MTQTFAQSKAMHDAQSKQLYAGDKGVVSKFEDVQKAQSFEDCYQGLHSIIAYTSDVTNDELKANLLKYRDVLVLLKFINKPGNKNRNDYSDVDESKHTELYDAAYQNFVDQNLK